MESTASSVSITRLPWRGQWMANTESELQSCADAETGDLAAESGKVVEGIEPRGKRPTVSRELFIFEAGCGEPEEGLIKVGIQRDSTRRFSVASQLPLGRLVVDEVTH
jgi:hypothetical protein